MSHLHLGARPVDDGFACDHVDPDGARWTLCAHSHPTADVALRCATLTVDDRAIDLARTHSAALYGEPRAWDALTPAEHSAWRLVAVSSLTGGRYVRGVE